jgi:heme o synthase
VFVKDILSLGKIKITLPVALSGFTGYLIKNQSAEGALWPVVGILLLAMASAALNNLTEFRYDALMHRTANRPLPSGRVKPLSAFVFALLLLISGLMLLWFTAGITAFAIGILTLVWYNGVYTLLKRVTAWAVIPGSLVGALPPAIGYAAAGGCIADAEIVVLSTFFFIGQIPHFWILLLVHGDDYLNAGFKSLSTVFNYMQLRIITFAWVLSTALYTMIFPVVGIIRNEVILYVMASLAALMSIFMIYMLLVKRSSKIHLVFMAFNVYFLIIMVLLWLEVFV